MLRFLASLAVAVELYLAGVAAASALPVPLVAVAFAITTPWIAVAVTFAINVALSVGLSYLAAALMPKPKMPDISSLPGGTTGRLQSGGAVPRSFIVGRGMTAGSLVYANTYSPTTALTAEEIIVAANQIGGWAGAVFPTVYAQLQAAGNTPNAYLVQVIALSDIPVTGLVGMFVGSTQVTWNQSTTPSLEGIPIPEYASGGKDHLWVRFYDGTQTAADDVLVNLFGTDPDRPYTSARVGTGVAYAVVTSLVNQDLFAGFPQFKFVLDGVKLYDRRYDSSVGGSGSQRWATPSTWALSANNIVIVENILRGISYGGSWVYGAQTVTATQIPSASWTAAASECDAAIDLAAGGTEVQFKAGGEIRFDVEPAATIEELLKACNGRLAEIGGTYKVRAGAAGAAVFSFTDADILSTEQQTFDPFPSLGQTINAVTAKYISPAEGWMPKDAPPLYDAALETADGGRRQPVDVSYGFVTSGTQVQRLMRAARDDHRAMRVHGLPMPPDSFVLEPLDIVSWTSTRNGYASKLFEIESADDLPNLNMSLAIREIDENAYDWVPASDEQAVTDGTIVVVRPPPQSIVDWSAVPWVILSDDNREAPGIKLSWDPNTTDVNGVRFEIRIKDTAEVVHRGETDGVGAGSIIIGQNLISDTTYQARGQYRPQSFRDVTWSDWLDVTTPDIRVILDSLDLGLSDFITGEFQRVIDSANATAALIASVATEQEAANWLDKYDSRVLLNTAIAEVENVAELYADGVVEALSTEVAATYATTAAVATAKAEAIAVAASDVDSSIAAYAIVAEATFATPAAVATAKSEAIAVAASDADSAIAAYDITVQATYATPANVATAKSEAIASAVATADAALAAFEVTVDASLSGKSTTVTITIASPGVVTWTAHGFAAGQAVKFTTTGTLPTGITADTWYYVLAAGLATDTFRIGTTAIGSAINTSGTQSGTHTGTSQGVTAGVTTNAVAGATTNSSVASLETSVNASLSSLSADVSTNATAITTTTNSLASLQSSVSASLAGASATVTMTIASPCVVSWTAHGFLAGQAVKFSTTGTLPTGITADTWYYVISAGLAAGTFRISATPGGSAVNTSGTQSGTHTGTPLGLSSGVTTNATAIATIDGQLAAQWLVTLDVNGYVSGVQAYNDGATADFILIADNFQVASPADLNLDAATVTISIASPAVITSPAHGLTAGQVVIFTTTGALPTGLTTVPWYYVISAGLTADSYRVSENFGGAAVNTSGTQSGVHTVKAPVGNPSFSIASPCVVSWASNGLVVGQTVMFETSAGGALPTGITAGRWYYVIAAGFSAGVSFRISETLGGTAINTSGTQSGIKYGYRGGGGAPVPMFQVANVGGVGKMTLRGDMVADGTISSTKMVTGTITAASGIIGSAAITTANIQDLAVGTLKLAGNAVSSVAVQTLTNTLTNGTFNSASTVSQNVDLPVGSQITAIATIGASVGFVGTSSNSWTLFIEGEAVQSASGTTIDYTLTMVGTKLITLTSQPQTIEAHMNCTMSASAETSTRTLSLQIFKR